MALLAKAILMVLFLSLAILINRYQGPLRFWFAEGG